MARPRTTLATRLLLACGLIGLVVSTDLTRAQDEPPVEEVVEDVVAVDEAPPYFTQVPDSFSVDAVGAFNTVVRYDVFAADDFGDVDVDCSPSSGSEFPVGETYVYCSATDEAGFVAETGFTVTVVDVTRPEIFVPAGIGPLDGGPQEVRYEVGASDNVDDSPDVECTYPSGSLFDVGTTTVSCRATDYSGNVSDASFDVTINALPTPTPVPPTETPVPPTETPVPPTSTPEPEPTDTPKPEPTETEKPEATKTPRPTKTPTPDATATEGPEPTETPDATGTPKATAIASATKAPTATRTATPTPTKPPAASSGTPAALGLPAGLPANVVLDRDGGPVDGLAMMWDYDSYPISQEFGHTWFSVRHSSWYAYGRAYGLDGFEHTGLDVGMPRGTPLFSPVDGVVRVSGGTPYFTFYGNGEPGVGELLIETKEGHEVILGHMGRITVGVGERVRVGEFVGLSGGENGDHLHLEVRQREGGGFLRIVDPRRSFLVGVIESAADADARRAATRRAFGLTLGMTAAEKMATLDKVAAEMAAAERIAAQRASG